MSGLSESPEAVAVARTRSSGTRLLDSLGLRPDRSAKAAPGPTGDSLILHVYV